VTQSHTFGRRNQRCRFGVFSAARVAARPRGHAPEDPERFVNRLPRLSRRILASPLPKLVLVLGCSPVLSPTDWQLQKHGFGLFSRTCLVVSVLGRHGGAFRGQSHGQVSKTLRRLHSPDRSLIFPPSRETLRWRISLGVATRDACDSTNLKSLSTVSAHVAIDFGQGGEFFAFVWLTSKHSGPDPTGVRCPSVLRP